MLTEIDPREVTIGEIISFQFRPFRRPFSTFIIAYFSQLYNKARVGEQTNYKY